MQRSNRYGRERANGLGLFRGLFLGLCMRVFLVALWQVGDARQPVAVASNPSHALAAAGSPSVDLRSASGESIRFVPDNNHPVGGIDPQSQDIPHLVLFRNGALSASSERTLILTVGDLVLPPGGIILNVRLETQGADPDLGGGDSPRITVWQASRRLDNPQDIDLSGQSASFTVQFADAIPSSAGFVPTPTGYYRYQLDFLNPSSPAVAPLYSLSQEYAFLLESQWIVPLQGVYAAAGPQVLVVYYCDMFPFQRDARDPASRLPRREVSGYIQNELLPGMLAAIRLQALDWGLSLDGWSASGRENLAVALSDGETWFHGPAPRRGNSSISINVRAADNANYATLTDGLMSTFHHELFHIFQISLALSNGITSDFDGAGTAWQFFTEGTASFAATVAQPGVQFAQSGEARTYLARAIQFVGGKGFPGDLNSSYVDIDPYHAALYWRFLYERCGGMAGGAELSQVGMRVVRRALQEFYARGAVDISTSSDLVRGLPAIMDRLLSSPEASACPFRTFADSLVHFSRAIYTLHVEGGRCTAPGIPVGCGLYDPNSLYSTPRTAALTFSGAGIDFSAQAQPYPAGIRSSFGMDFIDIQLAPGVQGQPITIELHGEPSGGTVFSLQVVRLWDQDAGWGSQPALLRGLPVAALASGAAGDLLVLSLSPADLAASNRLGVIITRLDAGEALDPLGAYTLLVKPGN